MITIAITITGDINTYFQRIIILLKDLKILDEKVWRRGVVVRVSRISVGVNCECLESVIYMGSDEDTSDHCLLSQEKLYMSCRGARREHILKPGTLQGILILIAL